MKRYELTPGEVSPKAYSVYANSSFTVWTGGNEFYLTDNGRYSERDVSASGTLEEIAEVLESYGEDEEI